MMTKQQKKQQDNSMEALVKVHRNVDVDHYREALDGKKLLVSEMVEIALVGIYYRCETQARMILQYLESIGHETSTRLGYAVLAASERDYSKALELIRLPFDNQHLESKRRKFFRLLCEMSAKQM